MSKLEKHIKSTRAHLGGGNPIRQNTESSLFSQQKSEKLIYIGKFWKKGILSVTEILFFEESKVPTLLTLILLKQKCKSVSRTQ